MMDPSLALQVALRGRLVAFAALTALVPATNILDHIGPAQRYPAVLIGEGLTVAAVTSIERDMDRVYLDLHVWAEDDDLASVKIIAGTIRDALRNISPFAITDHRVIDLVSPMQRFMRDKQSETPLAHAVISINALMQEVSS